MSLSLAEKWRAWKLTFDEEEQLCITDHEAWVSYVEARPGIFESEAEAQAVADDSNANEAEYREQNGLCANFFKYGAHVNPNGGFDVYNVKSSTSIKES